MTGFDEGGGRAADALDQLLDREIDGMRNDLPSERVIADSLARVRGRLADEGVLDGARGHAPDRALESCADYQALMPAFVAGTLEPSLRLLVEDHTRSCVPCRRALKAVRAGEPIQAEGDRETGRGPQRSGLVQGIYALAAIFLVALAGWLAWNVLRGDGTDLVQVRGIEGQLFQVAEQGLVPLQPGDWIDGGVEIRTANGSGARVELADGSRVEIDERSALEVVRKRGGHRIRVSRGSIIVEAADQGTGSLDVATNELLATVKGTIFSVRHGVKGSRVSVIEGEVEVENGRKRTSLYPGDQIGSRATMVAAPWAQEIGWSQNVDQYLAMLEEFQQLRRDLNQVLSSTTPRYESSLVELVPSTTVVYIALPNPTATVGEIYQMIRQRVDSNPALASWWGEAGHGSLSEIDDFVATLRELGSYLGAETVVALGLDAEGEIDRPAVLSEVADPIGLRAGLEAELAALQQSMPDLPVVLVDDPAQIDGSLERLFVWVGDEVMIASTEADEIRRIAAGTSDGFAAGGFYEQIAASYAMGADYLGAVDLASVFDRLVAGEIASQAPSADSGGEGDFDTAEALEFVGLGNVRYLVVERHQEGDRSHTAADLTFEGERSGLAAWLATPAPMGALGFFSADTSFVAGVVTRDPIDVLDEVLDFAASQGGDPYQGLSEFELQTGLDLRGDILATLGGESAFGIDGPALPVPSWKAVVEVYDEGQLQYSLEQMVERLNQEFPEGVATIEVTSAGGRIYHELTLTLPEESVVESVSVHYAYVDGYMVLGPTRALIEQAIQYWESGAGVTASSQFQALLPTDGYTDFSAVVYNRLGETVRGVLDSLPRPDSMTSEQSARFDALVDSMAQSGGPGLYCLYGEADRIRLVSNSPTFLPFAGLESVIGLGAMLGDSGLAAAIDLQDI
ncbi:MAG: hypothetical protein DWQ36_10620 [Acidobacteria bacterium]|nr:MAG: hypothetical protein DWQ36_10620 [Acidobacteriota bacterium]